MPPAVQRCRRPPLSCAGRHQATWNAPLRSSSRTQMDLPVQVTYTHTGILLGFAVLGQLACMLSCSPRHGTQTSKLALLTCTGCSPSTMQCHNHAISIQGSGHIGHGKPQQATTPFHKGAEVCLAGCPVAYSTSTSRQAFFGSLVPNQPRAWLVCCLLFSGPVPHLLGPPEGPTSTLVVPPLLCWMCAAQSSS